MIENPTQKAQELAESDQQRPTASKNLRIGMIGAGFITQVAHLYAFSKIDNTRVVALAESDDFLRTEVAEKFGIDVAVPNYKELLRRTDIDALVICVPRRAQSLLVAEAFAMGCPVLSEKPMAMTLREATAMTSLAERKGARWMVGYMKQFDPGVRHFKHMLAGFRTSGELGDVLNASMRDYCATYGTNVPKHVRRQGPRAHRYAEASIAPDFVSEDYRGDYEYTVNVASHDINLLRSLFGDGLAARSLDIRHRGAQHMFFDVEDIPITLAVAPVDVGYWDQRLDINFKRGRLSLTLPSPLARDRSAIVRVERAGSPEEICASSEKHVWAFEAQARAFADAARSGATPPNSGAECLADMAIIENLWKKMEFK